MAEAFTGRNAGVQRALRRRGSMRSARVCSFVNVRTLDKRPLAPLALRRRVEETLFDCKLPN